MENEELIVAGFSFQNLEDAELAREEEKKIIYIESRMNYEKPQGILPIYKKMLDGNLFQTPVGYLYLCQLKSFLENNIEEEIPPISIGRVYKPVIEKAKKERAIEKLENEKRLLKKRGKWSIIINCILVIVIVIMFLITMKGTNPTILNYERALINKYASWEEDLKEREQKIREWEKENTQNIHN